MNEKLHQSELKLHHNKEYLEEKIKEGYTSVEIAKAIGVSWKLVEIYLRKYEIPHTSKREMQ